MSDGQREALQALSRSQTAPHRQVQRAKALLLAADGVANVRIAAQVGVKPATVRAWRARFAEEGLAKLGKVRAGRGRKSTIPQQKIDEIVHLTRHSTPDGQTHWSCRTMAAKAGVSPATVQRVWAARGLKPHLVETFKLSNDPKFEEKLIDVAGLYLSPPEKAIVLCMDEKSQVQALDRTQPSLPMKQGRAQTMTHDYKRNGTTTLFAALNVLTGVVIGQCLPRHRHEEFLKFLRTIDREVPETPCGASDPGQLRHPQPPRRADLAGPPPAVPPALHPDLLVVAEPGRTLVPRTHRQGTTPWQLQLRARPHHRHRGIPRRPQPRPQTLRLDRHRGDRSSKRSAADASPSNK